MIINSTLLRRVRQRHLLSLIFTPRHLYGVSLQATARLGLPSLKLSPKTLHSLPHSHLQRHRALPSFVFSTRSITVSLPNFCPVKSLNFPKINRLLLTNCRKRSIMQTILDASSPALFTYLKVILQQGSRGVKHVLSPFENTANSFKDTANGAADRFYS